MKKPYLQCTGEEWEKVRMRILVRDGFTCQAHRLGLGDVEHCSEDDPETRVRHLHVHHIKQRQHGGTHDPDNLITVCRLHHHEIHPHMKFEVGRDVGWVYEADFGWEY